MEVSEGAVKVAHGTAGPGDAGQAAAASLLGITMRGLVQTLETLSPDEPRQKGISVKENAVSSEEDSNQKEISTSAQE